MFITIRQLPSGYFHIRGTGPCNWTQPPSLSANDIREYAFPEASPEFLTDATKAAARQIISPRPDHPLTLETTHGQHE